ncbi:hypothetical protein KI387_018457, partial [Taxus chinensis]
MHKCILGHLGRKRCEGRGSGESARKWNNSHENFGTLGMKTRETRDSGVSAEKVTMSPKKFGTFGTQVREVRGLGVLVSKMEQLAELTLGHLEHESAKYAVR